jgi:rod shape-determining protein MreC
VIARLHSERGRTLLLLIGLTALVVGLDAWQRAAQRRGESTWFEGSICAVSLPLQKALLSSAQFFDREWMATVHARDLIDQNAELAARAAALESLLSEMKEQRGAAERAAAVRSAYPGREADRALARVIGLGESAWSSYFTLDRGTAEGVQVRDVAASAEGVVGQIYGVATHTARVMPITEPSSAVAVRLQRSRDTGILKGLGDWRCEVRHLDPEADVRVGDRVITSGLGGVFPNGLRVGTVLSVKSDMYTPGKVAEVEPAADLERIEDVLLLRGRSGEGTPVAPTSHFETPR